MNPDLARLQPYPFERLRALLAGIEPAPLSSISLSIGEPKYPAPPAVLAALVDDLASVERYPSTRGTDAFRGVVAHWLHDRYGLDDPEVLAARHLLPLNGTREGLFAVAQCLLERGGTRPLVLMPNPFYQIYEGAALMAGCEPSFYAIDDDADANLDAIDEATWARCQMIYVCSPGNPTGAVLSIGALGRLIERADRHGFTIVGDECYGEIYREAASPPTGLLEAARQVGNHDFRHCLSFHSLSKRSNLPGLRSGFVAGDATLIERFLEYRTYHGCSMPGFVASASIAAWRDEAHVVENRRAYDTSYAATIEALAPALALDVPPGGFYLWPAIPVDDERFARELFATRNVRVVPGSYLARDGGRGRDGPGGTSNPGSGRVRLALVAPLEDCVTGATRIVERLLDNHTRSEPAKQ